MASPAITEISRARHESVVQTGPEPISRLLIVAAEFPPAGGGVSRVGESLAASFSDEGVEVGLVGPKVSADYARGRQFRFWGFRNRFVDLPIALGRAIGAFRPDVCLFTTWWPGACWHSRLFPEVPFAVIYHGVELLNSTATLKKRIRGILAARAIRPVLARGACHFAVSDYTRTLLMKHAPGGMAERVKTIPNGVSPDWPAFRRPADPPAPPYILFVGRLERTKGVLTLIRAFEEFARTKESHQLVLVGDGPLRSYISVSKAAAVNVSQSFAFLLAPFNINVNCICPGLVWTPLWQKVGRERFDALVRETTPLGREQTPEDVGKLAAFLCSERARNIAGQAINLSGGWQMN